MKYGIVIILCFFSLMAQARDKQLVDRIYPPIENVDTISVNCRIIKKYKHKKQIMELLAIVDGSHDTIKIVAENKVGKSLKLDKTYAFSVVKVREFSLAIIRNGYLLQVFFDRDTKNNAYVAYVNKVKPLLYVLLRNNGFVSNDEK